MSGCLQRQLDRRTAGDQSVLKSTAGKLFRMSLSWAQRPGSRVTSVIEMPGALCTCTGRELGYWRWPELSCCLLVLVDQPCEPGSALDLGGWDGEGDDLRVVVRRAQFHVLAWWLRPVL